MSSRLDIKTKKVIFASVYIPFATARDHDNGESTLRITEMFPNFPICTRGSRDLSHARITHRPDNGECR